MQIKAASEGACNDIHSMTASINFWQNKELILET